VGWWEGRVSAGRGAGTSFISVFFAWFYFWETTPRPLGDAQFEELCPQSRRRGTA